jgi:hypothetical protein
MSTRDLELLLRTKDTQRFIDADPTIITLRTKVATKSKGTVTYDDGPDRDPQSFKIIWNADSGVGRLPDRTGGVTRLPFVLLGVPTAIVELHDFFLDNGNLYTIEWIAPPNGYEVKAGGFCDGPTPKL